MTKLASLLFLLVVFGIQTPGSPPRLKTCSAAASPGSVECEGSTTCPEHNVTSVFASQTKQVWNMQKSKYCTYGLYRHALAEPVGKTHEFWELCGCE
jgi:hypothetical protein